MKRCTKCRAILPLSCFRVREDEKYRLFFVSSCLECQRAAAKAKSYVGTQRVRDYHRHYAAARNAAKMKQTPPWADHKAIRAFYTACPPGHHVDHIVPLKGKTVCGLHVLANLQYLPASENIAKGNKLTAAACADNAWNGQHPHDLYIGFQFSLPYSS